MSQVLTSYLNRPKIYTPDDAAFYSQYGDWPHPIVDLRFNDYESSTLETAISDTSSTSIVVSSTISLSVPFYLRVDSETMLCTANDGTTLTVTRGAVSSTAATHSIGATIYAYKFVDNCGKVWTPYMGPKIVDGQAVFESGQRLVASAHDDFDFGSSNFDISMDVTTTSAVENCTLLAKGSSWASGAWAWQFNQGVFTGCINVFMFDYNTSTALLQASTGHINDGTQHHVMWKHNGSVHQLLVDDAVVASATATLTVSSNNSGVYLGYDQAFARGFVGTIDNLHIDRT